MPFSHFQQRCGGVTIKKFKGYLNAILSFQLKKRSLKRNSGFFLKKLISSFKLNQMTHNHWSGWPTNSEIFYKYLIVPYELLAT